MEKEFYFAYGSNMSHIQMAQRCPNSEFICKGNIIGFHFVYDGYSKTRKGAVANIVEDSKGIVWGGLFKINKSDLDLLDMYEGYPKIYKRMMLQVNQEIGIINNAMVYYRENQKCDNPTYEYQEIVRQGALECNLPEDYIKNYIEVLK